MSSEATAAKDGSAVNAFSSDPEAVSTLFDSTGLVQSHSPNVVYTTTATPNDPGFNKLWGLENTPQNVPGSGFGTQDADIDATEAWDKQTGSRSVIIGVIDTGIDFSHPDLSLNIWTNSGEIPGDGIDNDGSGLPDDVNGYDFVNWDADPSDDNFLQYHPLSKSCVAHPTFHGTHVSGTIAANGDNNLGLTGVAWDASLLSVKAFTACGLGSANSISSSINYVSNLHKIGNKDLVATNNSWGSLSPGVFLANAIANAVSNNENEGMLFVAAAGNDGIDIDTNVVLPASLPNSNVISVAATKNDDKKAAFSNFGAVNVDLAAPGVGILSTSTSATGTGYQYLDGTSMAAPHVTGTAALLWSFDRTLPYQTVRDCILNTVDPITDLAGDVATGGRLNANRAVMCVTGEVWFEGTKFDDIDGDGVRQPWEPGLAGWTIYLDANNNGQLDTGEQSTTTDAAGMYWFVDVAPGTYPVREVQTGWFQTTAPPSPIVVSAGATGAITGVDFGNFELIDICGTKFEDLNGNGVWDEGEPGLDGWEIYLDLNNDGKWDNGEPKQVTINGGEYCFLNQRPGTYIVREVLKDGWAASLGNDGHVIKAKSGVDPSTGECSGGKPLFDDPAFAAFSGQIATATCFAAAPHDDVFAIFHVDDLNPSLHLGFNAWPASPYNVPLAAPNPPDIKVYHRAEWSKARLGDIYGVTYDDLGNIYVTASSIYGLSFATGGSTTNIDPAFGPGGPGGVYKIDRRSGSVSVFATLPNLVPTNRLETPALGNITFDQATESFFVSNFEDGQIYKLDRAGVTTATFSHANSRTNPNPAQIDPVDGRAAPLGDRVWGLATHNGRLYYSVWWQNNPTAYSTVNPNEIWSINTLFTGPPLREISISAALAPSTGFSYTHPVSDISFGPRGTMLLGERSMQSFSPADPKLANALSSFSHESRTLEFAPNGGSWAQTNVFNVGSVNQPGQFANSAGGVDYDYAPSGRVWVTGDALRVFATPPQRIYGLQGLPNNGGNYQNSYLVDLDGRLGYQDKSEPGDVEIPCRPGVNFGNHRLSSVHGKKYEDLNGNGQFDSGQFTATGGEDDSYVLTNGSEKPSPHADLIAAFGPNPPLADYDDSIPSSLPDPFRFFLESLPLPTNVVGIKSATLRFRASPDSSSFFPEADSISVGVWGGNTTNADRFTNRFGIDPLPGPGIIPPPLVNAIWRPGQQFDGTITLPANVISAMELHRRLDIVIGTGTVVDFVELIIDYMEPCLDGWDITLSGTDNDGNPVTRTTTTMVDDPTTNENEAGMYWLEDLKPGTYTICETLPSGDPPPWIQSQPGGPSCYTVTVGSGQVITDLDFGNYRPAAIHGRKFFQVEVAETLTRGVADCRLEGDIKECDRNNVESIDQSQGLMDLFANSPNLSPKGYDNLSAGKQFGDSFQGLPSEILSATLKIWVCPINGSTNTQSDTVNLESLFPLGPSMTHSFTVNGRSLISVQLTPAFIQTLNQRGHLDVRMSGDILVDSMELDLTYVDEVGRNGWQMTLLDANGPVATQKTMTMGGEDGWYWFDRLMPGSYTVKEESRATAVEPRSRQRNQFIASGQVLTDQDFLNTNRWVNCECDPGGATLGIVKTGFDELFQSNTTAHVLTFDGVAGLIHAGQFSESHGIYLDSLAHVRVDDFSSDPALQGLQLIQGAQWHTMGGIDDSGYLSLTDAGPFLRGVAVYPELRAGDEIESFRLSADLRIGGGSDRPADGISFSLVRPDDPVLQEPIGRGFADLPNGVAQDLPEEGTQTGISIGLDEWFNENPDVIGISIRVDNQLLAEVPFPVLNGTVDDDQSLQTGPVGVDSSELGWAQLEIELREDRSLRVTYKGRVVSDEVIDWVPGPGQLVIGGRTGSANSHHHVDNLSFSTNGTSRAAQGVYPEGGPIIETLDGYNGSYRPDGDNVFVIFPNHVEPFEISFDEPVAAVGSFIATGDEGDVETLTIEAYDAYGNLLNESSATVALFEDGKNREGFWGIGIDDDVIASVKILNDNPIDFGNALIIDNIQWERTADRQAEFERLAAEFDEFFANQPHPSTTTTFGAFPLGPLVPETLVEDQVITDWQSIDVSTETATGTLGTANVTFSGTDIFAGTTDGTSTRFSTPSFTPPVPMTDAVLFLVQPTDANNYSFNFSCAITDPVFHFQSLASTLTFPAPINKISGDNIFAVAGNTVSGVVSGSTDANGTVQLPGTYTTVNFSASFAEGPNDGVAMQLGANDAHICSTAEKPLEFIISANAENQDPLVIAAEGSIETGWLDGYDGSFAPDGAHVVTQTNVEGTVPGIRLEFIEPVSAVGSYVGISSQARSINHKGIASGRSSIIVTVFDTDENELGTVEWPSRLFNDFDNDEVFWAVDLPEPRIGAVEIAIAGEANDTFSQMLIDHVTVARPETVELPGDFNGDVVLNCEDLRLMNVEIVPGNNSPQFDLNGDGLVDYGDTSFWISDVFGTIPGDANLDRVVDAKDLNTMALNWRGGGEDVYWCEADFNGDNVVNAIDLNELALNWQNSRPPRRYARPAPLPTQVKTPNFAGNDARHPADNRLSGQRNGTD